MIVNTQPGVHLSPALQEVEKCKKQYSQTWDHQLKIIIFICNVFSKVEDMLIKINIQKSVVFIYANNELS